MLSGGEASFLFCITPADRERPLPDLQELREHTLELEPWGRDGSLGPISALQPVYFFSPGALEMLLGKEKGKIYTASLNVRNGTW